VQALERRAPRIAGVELQREAQPPLSSRAALAPRAPSMTTSFAEALLGLVPGSVFKTDGAPRERRHGGFDSRALPFLFS
jgi:hypothetical protein